jgi:isochorismate synthase
MDVKTSFVLLREPGQPLWGAALEETASFSEGREGAALFYVHPFHGEGTTYRLGKRFEGPEALAQARKAHRTLPPLEVPSSHTEPEYKQLVERAIEACRDGALTKVVTSRRVVHAPETFYNTVDAFAALCERYPDAMVYLLYREGQTTWMGASPEWLLHRDGTHLRTMSLAGTRPAGSTGHWGAKEKEEQDLVTQDIAYMLRAMGASELTVDGPVVRVAGPVEHLCTWIEGELPPPASSLSLAQSLHPTPAVGGLPRARASAFLRAHEGYDRGLYAGYMGWSSGSTARFYVNLRCMEVGQQAVALYAGGGITAQSNPQREWEETEAKLQTLRSAIFAQ